MPTGPPDSAAGASGAPRLSEQLRRRVLPATLAIGLLISIGFPVVYVALEVQALRRNARVYAQHIASRVEDLVLQTPSLWRYQTYKYAEILYGLPKSEPIHRITIYDANRQKLAEYEPDGDSATFWDKHDASASAPIRFQGGAIGSVEVGMSYRSLLAVSVVVFALSAGVGIGLALVVYRYPARIARSLEGRVYDLVDETARTNRELTRVLVDTRRQRQIATALEEVARDLTSSLQWERVVQRIVDRARDLCSSDLAIFAPYDAERARATVGAASGTRTPVVGTLTILPGRGAAGKVLETGQPFATDDYLNDPRVSPEYRANIATEGVISLAVVPVKFDDAITGILWVARRTARPFGEADLAMLSRLGDQAAIAQKNARLYREAERALADLQVAQEQLVRGETLRAVGELAGGMAHHLNNVLAVILGHVQLLVGKVDDPAIRRGLTIVERATLDGAEVVRRVQRFTQADADAAEADVDLNELVKEVVEFTRFRWQDEPALRGARIEVRIEPGDIPHVIGTPGPLREVFVNLVMNAIEAVPSGGIVTVKTWATASDVWVSVSDTGPGMSDEVRRRAFEPFFTTKGPKSTGLGLSVAYGTVQRHGGEITVETAERRGTTVAVRLPRHARTGMAGAPARQAARALRILVVDDEPNVLSLTEDLLRSMGHETVAAANGRAALQALEATPDVDLVITDLGMPEMTGWELARSVKARRPNLPVAMMTGWGDTPPGGDHDRHLVAFIVPKPMLAQGLAQHIGLAPAPKPPR